MVFNPTFNNISAISWQSVLLVEETGVPRENHRPVASHWQTLLYYVAHLTLSRIRTHNISGNRYRLHRSNYHTITTMTAPNTDMSKGIDNLKQMYFWKLSDIAVICWWQMLLQTAYFVILNTNKMLLLLKFVNFKIVKILYTYKLFQKNFSPCCWVRDVNNTAMAFLSVVVEWYNEW